MIGLVEFQEVVRRRRMVRDYADRAVDPAVVDRCLANAQRAPSAGFSQGWGFLVLDEPATVRRFWEVTADPEHPDAWLTGMMRAPVVVLPCSSKQAYLDRYAEPDKGWADRDEARWPMPFWHMDAAMAALLVLQTAVDEGLGACFFGAVEVPALRAEFAIPDAFDPVGVITIGHRTDSTGAAGSPRTRSRRTDVVHRNRWT